MTTTSNWSQDEEEAVMAELAGFFLARGEMVNDDRIAVLRRHLLRHPADDVVEAVRNLSETSLDGRLSPAAIKVAIFDLRKRRAQEANARAALAQRRVEDLPVSEASVDVEGLVADASARARAAPIARMKRIGSNGRGFKRLADVGAAAAEGP